MEKLYEGEEIRELYHIADKNMQNHQKIFCSSPKIPSIHPHQNILLQYFLSAIEFLLLLLKIRSGCSTPKDIFLQNGRYYYLFYLSELEGSFVSFFEWIEVGLYFWSNVGLLWF